MAEDVAERARAPVEMSAPGLARLLDLRTFNDSRGALTSVEPPADLPFAIARLFWIHDVQPPFERGGHAHLATDHLLVCVHGRFEVELSDGTHVAHHVLDHPARGLLVPRMVWTRMFGFAPGSVCLAAASAAYDPAGVVRDWNEYLSRAGAGG